MSKISNIAPRPSHWPHRADPPGRYWGNYERYQKRGGQIRLEDDIQGLLGVSPAYGDISRFYFFCLAFDQLTKEGVRGDIAELGVYKGETATVLARMARRMNTTAWILDTFEGFNAADLQGVDAAHKQEFEDTSLESVRTLVGEQNVRYIKGYFPESASQLPVDLTFSLVHVDCDLYAPILQALKYFYPRLAPGGYLIIHDYACLAWDGAERAVDEFFADKPESVIPLTDGCGSAVIRKCRESSASNWVMHKRCELFCNDGKSAGHDALLDLLDKGWSGAESWGVWGIGPCHSMMITMAEVPVSDIVVEIDGAAALLETRPEQTVDVFSGGLHLATWRFVMQANRAQRVIRVPITAVTMNISNFPVFQLEFRPHSVAPIVELDPSRDDSRALGLALFGIRRVT